MSEREPTAAEVIESYRRRRERMVPLLLGGLSVVLLVVGIFLIVLWLTSGGGPSLPAIGATDTPTVTDTNTPLPPTDTPTVTLTATITETPTPEGPITYVVQEDDTLSSIAEQFGVDLDLLLAYNPDLADADTLFIGQEIVVPPPDAELPTATPLPATLLPGQEIEYRVRSGDTLASIAAEFNSTVEAIVERNDLENPNDIFAGQVLIIPVNIVTPTPTLPPTITPTPTP